MQSWWLRCATHDESIFFNYEECHSECEEINEEIDSQGPTTIVRGVCNQHSYMVGNATAQCEIPQVDFLQMINFLTMHFSSKQLFFIVMIYYKIFKNTWWLSFA